MSVVLSARRRDGDGPLSLYNVRFIARSHETGFRTAARKLGLTGPILTIERVGTEQWAINVDGTMMMVVER